MTSPKKDVSSSSRFPTKYTGQSTECQGKQDELAMLKDEVATLRSMVVYFPDHITHLIEMESEKMRKSIMDGMQKMVESLISKGAFGSKKEESEQNLNKSEKCVATSDEKNVKYSTGTSKGKRHADESSSRRSKLEQVSLTKQGNLAQGGRPGQGGKPAKEGSEAQECNEGQEGSPV
ncbi:hypothetical protein TorRG33x02_077390 [Trema orientale]|uniref:Uncharacterized protein n=1 Tax=Trema orientale TaxID=63057 RepID=A0A2P5FFD3_TREOI|nr:hypothetical protein TorRG33x02_077390 [Trema orientale]